MRTLATLILIPFLAVAPARADDTGIVSEVKVGVLYHDLRFIAASPVEEGVDVNGEILFASPSFFEPIWSPRPHLGVQVNTRGRTSQVYAGLTWTFYLVDRFWIGAGVGGALHNGETNRVGLSRKALGSDVLFRLSAEAGVDVTQNLSVSLYYDHESNAYLADRNPGLDNVGVRLGWKF